MAETPSPSTDTCLEPGCDSDVFGTVTAELSVEGGEEGCVIRVGRGGSGKLLNDGTIDAPMFELPFVVVDILPQVPHV